MDPDQWFRLWLAVGQGFGGGAVTLLGGYVGYRLAGRGERNKARSEALRDLNRALLGLSRFAENLPPGLTGSAAMGRIVDEYKTILEDAPPPRDTPANVISIELMPKLFQMSLNEAKADKEGRGGRPSPIREALRHIREARGECAKWVMKGPPSDRALANRNKAAKLAVEQIFETYRPRSAEA